MKTWQKIIHDDLNVVAEGLDELDRTRIHEEKLKQAVVGERYYDVEHDIKATKIMYYDDHDNLVEDKYASNQTISHAYFTELVDQKVQYLLANGVKIDTQDENLKELLEDYIDDDFQIFLNDMVEGSSIKGTEYAYARMSVNDRVKFEAADAKNTFAVYNDYFDEVAVVRKYSETIHHERKETILTYAEVYTDETVSFFIKEDGRDYVPDQSVTENPQSHIVGFDDSENTMIERDFGRIPFYRLDNNKKASSDLSAVKDLIDDYDLMASTLSNNLQNFDRPFFVIRGYQGESLDKIRKNIMAKGAVKVGAPNSQHAGVDIQTYQIPYEARQSKMETNREMIYKFGMGFDSSQKTGNNVTNIEIKARYTLLDLKCNKFEPRLRALVSWCLELIFDDLERLGLGSYDVSDVEIEIERNAIFNEKDHAETKLVEERTVGQKINNILDAATRLDDETTLKELCDLFELDYEEVASRIDTQDYERLAGDIYGEAE